MSDGRHTIITTIEVVKAIKEIEQERDYWKQRCEAAESFIEFSPGDPDITGLQINAHKKWLALKQHS